MPSRATYILIFTGALMLVKKTIIVRNILSMAIASLLILTRVLIMDSWFCGGNLFISFPCYFYNVHHCISCSLNYFINIDVYDNVLSNAESQLEGCVQNPQV